MKILHTANVLMTLLNLVNKALFVLFYDNVTTLHSWARVGGMYFDVVLSFASA